MDQVLLQKMPSLVRSNSRLYPNVTIPEFKFKTEGDDLLGREKRVPVNVTVVDTTGRFEASAAPNKAAIVRTFHIERIRLRTVYGSNLHLNDARRAAFLQNIEDKVTAVLYDTLYNDYMNVLGRAVEAVAFPRL
ncbi:hypothetical protein HPB48_007414 [Haemaphysalis longicornis]|uniref:Uncharacterized protein n=1 Tax=Haemaphysalis longicornis TaxID=44386 RepID=A0A9J6G6B6_HAELO|nr:hypothetical protein HPB48_007414 [Haemaphysalis longicornis]